MRDILPAEQKYFSYFSKNFERVCEQSGFKKIYTPTVEDTNLFVRGVGKTTDIVEKEMYTFKDKSGNSITLRPEGTASIVRAYLENGMTSMPQPVKLFYQMPMFRYDRPQANRYREHWQFGAEVIGEKSPLIDVTVISVVLRVLKSVGLSGLSLQINSIGCEACRPKYKKVLVSFLKEQEKELCPDCKRRLKTNPIRVLDCKEKSCQKVVAEAPQTINHLCAGCHSHFKVILEYLDEIDVLYELNSRLVRGLDYYSKTVFEVWNEEQRGQSTLAAGGRYDGLTEVLGGKAQAGIGFGIGADRVVAEMIKQNVSVEEENKVDVYVAQLGEEAKKKSFKLLFELQKAGVGAEGAIDKGSISDQLKAADRLGVIYTLIIGQKEAFSDTVIVKDMTSGSQEIYPMEKVVKEIQKRIAKITR